MEFLLQLLHVLLQFLFEFLCDFRIMAPIMPIKMELEDPEGRISWIKMDPLRFLERAGVSYTLPDIPMIHSNILPMIIQKLNFRYVYNATLWGFLT